MRLVLKVDGAGQFGWTVVRSREEPDPVARGARLYPDREACQDAAAQLLRIRPDSMLAVQRGDGRWGWLVLGPDGLPLAESPEIFDNAAACGYALHELRQWLAGHHT